MGEVSERDKKGYGVRRQFIAMASPAVRVARDGKTVGWGNGTATCM